VSHVSITINAVDPKIGEKIYAWVRYGKKSLAPAKGAEILLEKQLQSVAGLKERGIIVKVNTIVLPGINDHHVVDIAKKMAEFDVDLLNCMPYYPNEGSNFSHLAEPSKKEIAEIQAEAKVYIPQMLHCKRCRADAVGNLDDKPDMVLMESLKACASIKENPFETVIPIPSCDDTPAAANILDKIPEMEMAGESLLLSKKSEDRSADAFPITEDKANNANVADPSTPPSYVAVASREGVLVNQHLGEADALYIYDMTHKAPLLVDQRKLPEPGGMDFRWHGVADIIKDCHLVLVSGIGESPKRVLEERGLKVLSVNGLIHELLNALKQGQAINHLIKRTPSRCQMECTGTGMGCM
jgi:nitrogen fixation protein NifB